MGDSGSGYQLGSGEDDLELQGAALAPATRMIFAAGTVHSWAAAHRAR
jgi:hypothetical protein